MPTENLIREVWHMTPAEVMRYFDSTARLEARMNRPQPQPGPVCDLHNQNRVCPTCGRDALSVALQNNPCPGTYNLTQRNLP